MGPLKVVLRRDFSSVKSIDAYLVLVCASKKMTSIGKSNVSAPLNRYFLIRFEIFRENIHHSYFISKPNNNMET